MGNNGQYDDDSQVGIANLFTQTHMYCVFPCCETCHPSRLGRAQERMLPPCVRLENTQLRCIPKHQASAAVGSDSVAIGCSPSEATTRQSTTSTRTPTQCSMSGMCSQIVSPAQKQNTLWESTRKYPLEKIRTRF